MPGDVLKFTPKDPEEKEELSAALKKIMDLKLVDPKTKNQPSLKEKRLLSTTEALEYSFWKDIRAILRSPKTPLSHNMHASLLSVLADPKIQKSKHKKLFEQALNELVARNGVQAK